ncbi:hypothetical protein IKQ74_03905 [Candidatus Saccharibacteria bacterium]|nr:hypothetical protein [Candidatus Saccharibacteria bacterium]
MDVIDANAKYKRWGWGAVIALIGVILIAGLVVAVSMSSPKPNSGSDVITTTAGSENGANGNGSDNGNGGDNGSGGGNNTETGDGEKTEAEKKAEEEAAAKKKAEEEAAAKKKAEEEAAAKKKAEEERIARERAAKNSGLPQTGPVDSLMGFAALAVVVYLGALNLSFLKR